jgi:hypothetical protein
MPMSPRREEWNSTNDRIRAIVLLSAAVSEGQTLRNENNAFLPLRSEQISLYANLVGVIRRCAKGRKRL